MDDVLRMHEVCTQKKHALCFPACCKASKACSEGQEKRVNFLMSLKANFVLVFAVAPVCFKTNHLT